MEKPISNSTIAISSNSRNFDTSKYVKMQMIAKRDPKTGILRLNLSGNKANIK